MIIYQIVAKGSLACFGGSPHTIKSKELYTSPPGHREKEAFRQKCIKCEGAADLHSLDTESDISISVAEYELIDNGDFL